MRTAGGSKGTSGHPETFPPWFVKADGDATEFV
jgi:hypothetical protein